MNLTFLAPPEDLGPASDRFPGAPHPCEMLSLIGHREAEAEFLDAYRTGRMHHAWLIGGEEGIGKATLAYRMARFLLSNPESSLPEVQCATDLAVPESSAVAHQIAAHAHPDLAVIRRGLTADKKNIATEIRVDDVRKGLDVFSKTAGAGGWRIAIVDACDDLNASSANALLKTLEEPPARSLFLLVTHQPRRLLPTIRSRCRSLMLRPLSGSEVLRVTTGLGEPFSTAPIEQHEKTAGLAQGSVRRALTYLDARQFALHERIEALFEKFPRVDDALVDTLAEEMMGRAGENAFSQFCDTAADWLTTQLHSAETSPASLAPFAELWKKLSDARREIEIYNLDRRPFVIAFVSELASVSGRHST